MELYWQSKVINIYLMCVKSKSLSMQELIFCNLSFDLPGFLPRALLTSKISQVHSHVLCRVLFLPRTSDVFWLVLIHFWTLFLSNVSSWRRISRNFGNDGSENVYNVTWWDWPYGHSIHQNSWMEKIFWVHTGCCISGPHGVSATKSAQCTCYQ